MLKFEFDPQRVAWVFTDSDLERMLVMLSEAEEIAFDLETTGLDENAVTGGEANGGVSARVVLASFTFRAADGQGDTWLLPLSHPESPFSGRWRDVLRRVADEITVPLIGHNIKFDCRWVYASTGVDFADKIGWDTQLSSHLLDENRSTKLKEVAPRTFGIERWDDFSLAGPGAAEEVPLFDLGMYAARDTYWTWALSVSHRADMFVWEDDEPYTPDEIEQARLGKLARNLVLPTSSTLTKIEQRGIGLDVEWVEQRIAEYEETTAKTFAELVNRYPDIDPGGASLAPTSSWFKMWMDRAIDCGDIEVTELTPGGKPSWSKSILGRQARRGSEIASQLSEYRQLMKRLEYLRSWLKYVTPAGRVHANYNVGHVVTGRLSSSGPNMQQVTSALRPAFVPRPGYVFADLDFSQIELRVAAFIAPSEPMKEAFRRGEDLHTLLAAKLTSKQLSDVTPEERQKAKAANFGLLYGMGAYGFKLYSEDVYGVTMTNEEAAQVHHAFFEMWEGMYEWHVRSGHRAQQTGQVVSPIGRVRRLPDIHSSNDERASGAVRAAINSPVQGFASDLMMLAASSIEGNVRGRERVDGARLVGTVHDSILAEVPEDRWEEVTEACIDRMVTVSEDLKMFHCEFDVPLAVEAKVGTRWGMADVGSM